ncbi:hypothetical protein C8R43DRAFT_109860 [Mycena crocata]|nr:hypothetical protein C8R43DRAFT_109860 [Mycena crocata]
MNLLCDLNCPDGGSLHRYILRQLSSPLHPSTHISTQSSPRYFHHRTELNNVAAKRNRTVQYSDTQSGPLNNAQWTSKVYVDGYEFGTGYGRTKGIAREGAASAALTLIAQGY